MFGLPKFLDSLVAPQRPRGVHEVEAEVASVKHLQGLYAVVVALALTIGVETLISDIADGGVAPAVIIASLGFMATLIPFYHGAQRHLDHAYVLGDPNSSRGGVLLLDFLALFFEAGLLTAMAASVAPSTSFTICFILLLVLDIVWLELFLVIAARTGRASASVLGNHERGWVLTNLPTVVIAGSLLALSTGGSLGSVGLLWMIGALAVARSVFDYWWNWAVYFPVEP